MRLLSSMWTGISDVPEASSSAPELRPVAIPTGSIMFNKPAATPKRVALHAVAEEVRELIELLAESRAGEEEFLAAAQLVRQAKDGLSAAGRSQNLQRLAARVEHVSKLATDAGVTPESAARQLSASEYESHPFFDLSPIAGLGNPIAPPLDLNVVDAEVRATASFGAAYEGPPGHVHGGWTAAVFDEVLGMAQSLDGVPGMTGRLSVHYRKPTPLHTTIRYSGRIASVDGRKKMVTGESFNNETGELLCEAEALFIAIDFAKFITLMAAKAEPGDASPSAESASVAGRSDAQ